MPSTTLTSTTRISTRARCSSWSRPWRRRGFLLASSSSRIELAPASQKAGGSVTPPALGRRAVANTAFILAARTASKLVSLVVVVVLANALGADGYGRYTTLIAFSALVSVLADFGFNPLYTREAARNPERLGDFLGTLLILKVALSAVALVALGLALRPGATGGGAADHHRLREPASRQLLRGRPRRLRRDRDRLRDRDPGRSHPLWRPRARRRGVLRVVVRRLLRLHMRLLSRRHQRVPDRPDTNAVRPRAREEVAPARAAVRPHLLLDEPLLPGRRTDPPAFPAVRRGRLVPVRVQAVRSPAVHSARDPGRGLPDTRRLLRQGPGPPPRRLPTLFQGPCPSRLAPDRRHVHARRPDRVGLQDVSAVGGVAADPRVCDRVPVRQLLVLRDAQRDQPPAPERVVDRDRIGSEHRPEPAAHPEVRVPRRERDHGGNGGRAQRSRLVVRAARAPRAAARLAASQLEDAARRRGDGRGPVAAVAFARVHRAGRGRGRLRRRAARAARCRRRGMAPARRQSRLCAVVPGLGGRGR